MPPTLEYQKPPTIRRGLRRTTVILLTVAWLWSAGGLLLIVGGSLFSVGHRYSMWGIETILFTGPVLGTIGLASLVTAACGGSVRLIVAAVGPVAFPMFIFALINICNWGPDDAFKPVTILIAIYVAVSLITTAVAWRV